MRTFVIIAVLLAIFSCDGYSGITEKDFPDKWESCTESDMVTIGRIIVENKVDVCGEFYVKTHTNEENLLLIACTPDGKNFKTYLIDTDSGKMLPFKHEIQPPY